MTRRHVLFLTMTDATGAPTARPLRDRTLPRSVRAGRYIRLRRRGRLPFLPGCATAAPYWPPPAGDSMPPRCPPGRPAGRGGTLPWPGGHPPPRSAGRRRLIKGCRASWTASTESAAVATTANCHQHNVCAIGHPAITGDQRGLLLRLCGHPRSHGTVGSRRGQLGDLEDALYEHTTSGAGTRHERKPPVSGGPSIIFGSPHQSLLPASSETSSLVTWACHSQERINRT